MRNRKTATISGLFRLSAVEIIVRMFLATIGTAAAAGGPRLCATPKMDTNVRMASAAGIHPPLCAPAGLNALARIHYAATASASIS